MLFFIVQVTSYCIKHDMVMFVLKTKNVQTLNFLLVKNMDKDFFRSENFNYKRPTFFELEATELAISFYWLSKGHPN